MHPFHTSRIHIHPVYTFACILFTHAQLNSSLPCMNIPPFHTRLCILSVNAICTIYFHLCHTCTYITPFIRSHASFLYLHAQLNIAYSPLPYMNIIHFSTLTCILSINAQCTMHIELLIFLYKHNTVARSKSFILDKNAHSSFLRS